MKKVFGKLSKKLGFTATEINVVLFVLGAFILGTGLNIIKEVRNSRNFIEFNYTHEDSLFNAYTGNDSIPVNTLINRNQKADKHQSVNFTKKSITKKIIDINSAAVSDFTSLPGIGPKIAGRIFDYREKHGPFSKADDLLNVKGIGKVKLAKIRDLISTE